MQRLYTKIKSEIVDADMVIENADISVTIKKNDEGSPNYCTCVIYNVSQNTYNILNDKSNEIRIYADIDEKGYILIFEGILRDIVKWKKAKNTVVTKRKRKRKTKTVKKPIQVHYNSPPISRNNNDGNIATIIELQDGFKNAYINNHYSCSYKGEVTNKQILNDILYYVKRQTTLGIGVISELDEKTFSNGRVVSGTLNNVIRQICATGNCISDIDNNIINIFKKNQTSDVYGYYLHGGICPKPEFNADKEIDVDAPFLPSINVGAFVKLDFEDIDGVYPVKSLESKIDNFGSAYETKLTLKVE